MSYVYTTLNPLPLTQSLLTTFYQHDRNTLLPFLISCRLTKRTNAALAMVNLALGIALRTPCTRTIKLSTALLFTGGT